ncbi:MAG TPA: anti-sigma factor [Arthrobacter sp.]|nr:anti-sigma factor [Arthrobacter sp.]
MDTPQPSDRLASPGHSTEGNDYAAADEDQSVLHADQLTGGADEDERRPMPTVTKWLLLALAAVVVIIGAIAVAGALGGTSDQDVADAPDVVTSQQDVEGGGTVDAAISLGKNAAVLTFNDVAAGRTYQIWRVPLDGSAPVSAGTIEAADITAGNPVVVDGVSTTRELAVSVEAPGGAESPSLPFAVVIPTPAG